jgi:hypothetical protein
MRAPLLSLWLGSSRQADVTPSILDDHVGFINVYRATFIEILIEAALAQYSRETPLAILIYEALSRHKLGLLSEGNAVGAIVVDRRAEELHV